MKESCRGAEVCKHAGQIKGVPLWRHTNNTVSNFSYTAHKIIKIQVQKYKYTYLASVQKRSSIFIEANFTYNRLIKSVGTHSRFLQYEVTSYISNENMSSILNQMLLRLILLYICHKIILQKLSTPVLLTLKLN